MHAVALNLPREGQWAERSIAVHHPFNPFNLYHAFNPFNLHHPFKPVNLRHSFNPPYTSVRCEIMPSLLAVMSCNRSDLWDGGWLRRGGVPVGEWV